MRESKFNFLFDHKGDNYVYNSFTGCFAKVDNEFLTLLENVRNNNQFYSESDTFNKMKLSGVIIDNDKDEYAEYRDLFEKTSLDPMSCTFTIALSFFVNKLVSLYKQLGEEAIVIIITHNSSIICEFDNIIEI